MDKVIVKCWQVPLQICQMGNFVIWRLESSSQGKECSLPTHILIPIWIRAELFSEIDHKNKHKENILSLIQGDPKRLSQMKMLFDQFKSGFH